MACGSNFGYSDPGSEKTTIIENSDPTSRNRNFIMWLSLALSIIAFLRK